MIIDKKFIYWKKIVNEWIYVKWIYVKWNNKVEITTENRKKESCQIIATHSSLFLAL